MQLRLFNIQRFCLHDGPGVRTTVFFQGCPLSCPWCHNPESWTAQTQIERLMEKCIGCGACAAACPLGVAAASDRAKCLHCGACAAVCPTGALQTLGEMRTVEDVAQEVMRDAIFAQTSGGGVTASGGECLLQAAGVAALLDSLKREGMHTAVDTSGAAPWTAFEAVLPVTDLFLYDVKCADPERHRTVVGCDNGPILDNLRRLSAVGASIWVRIPVVPGFNDSEEEMRAIGNLLSGLKLDKVELLRYHALGESKRSRLDLPSLFQAQPPSHERMGQWAALLRGVGLPAVYEEEAGHAAP